MNKVMISVVMAAYNEPIEMVKEAVDSIMNQTLKPHEIIIVVDNPNNSDLISILNGYSESIKVYVNEKNMGLPYSLNRGVRLSSGDLIARMDSDDVALPNRLEHEYEYMMKGQYDLISSNISYIDEEGNDLPIKHIAPRNDKQLYSLMKHVNCMSHPTYLFTRKLFDTIGGYKEELKAAQDYEFVNNAMYKGFKIGFDPDVLLKYRIRNGNISQQKNALQRFITYYTRKAYIRKKGYSKGYIEDCLKGEINDYNEFKCQYEKYQNCIMEKSLLRKRVQQAVMCIKYKYIRNILYHDFAYRILGMKL